MDSIIYAAALAALAVAAFTLHHQYLTHRASNPRRLPYPPGPKPLPVIGNLRDVPSTYFWRTFAKWAEIYGDVIHVRLFGQHFLILDSVEAVDDLLEKRSIYADRPQPVVLNELMGWSWALSNLPYGTEWRDQRRAFHQQFYPTNLVQYEHIMTQETRKSMLRLMHSPSQFMEHIRLAFAGTTFRIVYGISIDDTDNTYYKAAKFLMHDVAHDGHPFSSVVDELPFLKYMPEWLPGASFKKRALHYRSVLQEFRDKPFEVAVKAFGTAPASMVTNFLAIHSVDDTTDKETRLLSYISAVAYSAGADTSVSTMQSFFLAMLKYPDIQRRAQQEVDEVVGQDRLPEFEDLGSLPYVHAIVKELLRWQPVIPITTAHRLSDDDEYRGYFIPKGTIVLGNAWSILHDNVAYDEPMEFNAERFLNADGTLNSSVRDPDVAAFGYGRRKCPGRHFAKNGSLITIATILATLDIRAAEDDVSVSNPEKYTGDPPELMTSGLLSYPRPFKCSIVPRSSAAKELIRLSLKLDSKVESE